MLPKDKSDEIILCIAIGGWCRGISTPTPILLFLLSHPHMPACLSSPSNKDIFLSDSVPPWGRPTDPCSTRRPKPPPQSSMRSYCSCPSLLFILRSLSPGCPPDRAVGRGWVARTRSSLRLQTPSPRRSCQRAMLYPRHPGNPRALSSPSTRERDRVSPAPLRPQSGANAVTPPSEPLHTPPLTSPAPRVTQAQWLTSALSY